MGDKKEKERDIRQEYLKSIIEWFIKKKNKFLSEQLDEMGLLDLRKVKRADRRWINKALGAALKEKEQMIVGTFLKH